MSSRLATRLDLALLFLLAMVSESVAWGIVCYDCGDEGTANCYTEIKDCACCRTVHKVSLGMLMHQCVNTVAQISDGKCGLRDDTVICYTDYCNSAASDNGSTEGSGRPSVSMELISVALVYSVIIINFSYISP